jgi:aryl carrier-like protein
MRHTDEDDEEISTMNPPLDLDTVIARYASVAFDDGTALLEAGLESLALLRLAVDVTTNHDAEIDATGLVDMRTVGDLKKWLDTIATGGQAGLAC